MLSPYIRSFILERITSFATCFCHPKLLYTLWTFLSDKRCLWYTFGLCGFSEKPLVSKRNVQINLSIGSEISGMNLGLLTLFIFPKTIPLFVNKFRFENLNSYVKKFLEYLKNSFVFWPQTPKRTIGWNFSRTTSVCTFYSPWMHTRLWKILIFKNQISFLQSDSVDFFHEGHDLQLSNRSRSFLSR